MLALERRSEILSILDLENSVLVADLAHRYEVAEETIRRDLAKLESEGLAKRTYGGAILVDSTSIDASYKIRAKTNIEQKKLIASKIFDLVEDGENIMLDASSTCALIAKRLRHKKKLTIITNSVEILLEFADCRNTNVISTGGILRESSLSLVGRDAERVIGNFLVDKAIISCKGVDFEKGVMESTVTERDVKRAMIKSAKQVILALDSGKFGKLSFARLVEFSNIHTVVTDKEPTTEWVRFLQKQGIELISTAHTK